MHGFKGFGNTENFLMQAERLEYGTEYRHSRILLNLMFAIIIFVVVVTGNDAISLSLSIIALPKVSLNDNFTLKFC